MRRPLLILAGAAALLAGVIAFVVLRDDGGIAEATFEDGSVLVLREVSYGKNHRMSGGAWWQRLLSPFVPATFAAKWKLPVAVYTNRHPVLMVWVEHRLNSSTNRGRIMYGGSFVPAPYALQDDAGTELPQHVSGAVATTPNGRLIGVPFPAVPRLSRDLSFRLVYCALGLDRGYAATVKFANPLYDESLRSSPMNQPSISTTQHNLKIELGGLRRWRMIGYGGGMSQRTTRLLCHVTDLQDPASDWSVFSVSIVGEGGALYRYRVGDAGRNEKWAEYEFYATLATNQTWPLQLELYRSHGGSNDVYTARSVPVGATGTESSAVRVPLQGTTLVVRGFVRPAMALATVEPPNNDLLLVLVQATSSDGEALRIWRTNPESAHNSSELIIPPGVTHVDLTYALTRKAYVDLRAQPKR